MPSRLKFWCTASLAILLVNSALLWAFPTATAFNVANLLLHVFLGVAVAVFALILARIETRLLWTIGAAASGILLAIIGNTRDHKLVLWIHVALALFGVAVFFARRENFLSAKISVAAAAVVLIAGGAYRYWVPHPGDHIANPQTVPVSMNEEGAGPKSPFFPSGGNTADGKIVPSSF